MERNGSEAALSGRSGLEPTQRGEETTRKARMESSEEKEKKIKRPKRDVSRTCSQKLRRSSTMGHSMRDKEGGRGPLNRDYAQVNAFTSPLPLLASPHSTPHPLFHGRDKKSFASTRRDAPRFSNCCSSLPARREPSTLPRRFFFLSFSRVTRAVNNERSTCKRKLPT